LYPVAFGFADNESQARGLKNCLAKNATLIILPKIKGKDTTIFLHSKINIVATKHRMQASTMNRFPSCQALM
jgi:hypothetical protein